MHGAEGQEGGSGAGIPLLPVSPQLSPSRHCPQHPCATRSQTYGFGDHVTFPTLYWMQIKPKGMFSGRTSVSQHHSCCGLIPQTGSSPQNGDGYVGQPAPPLPFSGFSSLFSEDWPPGTTEMTSRLFPPLFFWELSESSLLLAESLRAEREDEEGLFDSLGVFLSSPGK